jgi:Cdc6-like AAA superfamily ATPase
MIPEKLYGRDRELTTLLTAFDRMVAGGRPQLVLVSGYSGIGKSAVVSLRQASSISTSATFRMPRWPRRFRVSSGRFSARQTKN